MADPIRDFIALTKPSIVRMCLVTTVGGLVLAPGEIGIGSAIAAVVGTALAVAGANAFNMWWERDLDAKMGRTKRRPLPARRLPPVLALRFAWMLALAGVAVLAIGTNVTTTVLGGLAIALYVLVYTPLKTRTPLALVIGAVPGAAPPLLGWTAVTDSVDLAGLVLFGILFAWQIPHFLAIALYRQSEYAAAGIRVVPIVRGAAVAKIQAVAWAMVLVPISLMLVPLGVAGGTYLLGAFLLGTGFLAWSFTGLHDEAGVRWARGFFLASLVYLPALVLVLVLDGLA